MQAVISRVHRIVTAGDAAAAAPPSPPRAPSHSSSPAAASGSCSPTHAADRNGDDLPPDMRLAVERLQYATLLSERKKAAKLLHELARGVAADSAGATALGAAAVPVLLSALVSDPRDTELMEAMLELLQELVAAAPATASALLESTDAGGSAGAGAGGSAFAAEPSAPATGLQTCLQLLQDPSPWIRGPTIALVKAIQEAAQPAFAAAVLECKEGLRRLLEVVADRREHIRDAALQVLVKLTERAPLVQQFLAFEDGFARLFEIMEAEGLADGSSVISDCLQIVNNMVRDNLLTQTLLRELPFLATHLPALLQLPRRHDDDDGDNVAGTAALSDGDSGVGPASKSYQKRRALKLALQLVRFLVAGLHEGVPDVKLDALAVRERARKEAELPQIQSFVGRQTALMGAIGELACCGSEALADLQLQALDLLELLGAANGGNQIMLVNLQSTPSRLSVLAEFVRLDCADDESPVSAAATSLLDSLFRDNETTKMAIFQQLNAPPPTADDSDDGDSGDVSTATPAGRVLLNALLANAEAIVKGSVPSAKLRARTVVAWKACHRLTSLLASSDYCKDLALRIPSEYDNADAQAVPGGRFFTRCLRVLKVSSSTAGRAPLGLPACVFQIKVAVLVLLIQWSQSCTKAVREVVGSVTNLSVLVDLFTTPETAAPNARLVAEAVHLRGLVATLLGCCLEFLVDARQQQLDEIQGLPVIRPPPSSSSRSSRENEMTREQLLVMISKRIGLQRFMDAFVEFQQAPLVAACARRSLSHSSRNLLPPRTAAYSDEMMDDDAHGEYLFALYEKAFLAAVRDIGDRVQNRIIAIYTSADSSAQDGVPVSASAVSAYQDLIRIQDKQIQEMAQELAALRAGSRGHSLQNSAVAGPFRPTASPRADDESVPERGAGAAATQAAEAALAQQTAELKRLHAIEKEELEARIRVLEAAAADREAKCDGLSAALELLESELVTRGSAALATASQANQATAATAQLPGELEALRERCDELEEQVKEERELRVQGERHFSLDRNELEMHHLYLQKEIEDLRMAVAERDEQVRESSQMVDALEAGQELAKKEIAALQQQLEEARSSQATGGGIEAAAGHAGPSGEELEAELKALRKELHASIAELELARETQRAFEQRCVRYLRGDDVPISSSSETPELSNGHSETSSASTAAVNAVEPMLQHGVAKEFFNLLEKHTTKTQEMEHELEHVASERSALETQLATTRAECVELQRRVQELEDNDAKRRESDAQADRSATVTALEEELSSLKSLAVTQVETLHELQARADRNESLAAAAAQEIESGHREVERLEREVTQLAATSSADTQAAEAKLRALESERDELRRHGSELATRLESEIALLKAAKRELEQQVVSPTPATSAESSEPGSSNASSSLDDVYILLASLEIECETLRESLRAARGDEAVAAAEKVSRQRGAVVSL
ncbi:hypothetical protein PybrP1_012533 [[Pythium] brassicae (nom. inval.)]|nr:hypothetical protein PybrP1_012533 [[Pythium] brassicae (nom. inval.)]